MVGLYWVLATWFIPTGLLLQVTNTTLLCTAVAVSCVYFLTAYELLTAGHGDRLAYICLGIFISWGAQAAWRAMSLLWLLSGQPRELVDNDLIGFFQFLVICGGILHITAPRAMDRRVPKERWIFVGCVAAAGAALGVLVVTLQPDLHALAGVIIPWIPR